MEVVTDIDEEVEEEDEVGGDVLEEVEDEDGSGIEVDVVGGTGLLELIGGGEDGIEEGGMLVVGGREGLVIGVEGIIVVVPEVIVVITVTTSVVLPPFAPGFPP